MRIRARKERLTELARTNCADFERAWAIRLDSRAAAASRRADYANAFSVIAEAHAELVECGVTDAHIHVDTREVLTEAASKAVARTVDHRMRRLGNTAANCTKMKAGTHKLR
jgi:hypothetical protein